MIVRVRHALALMATARLAIIITLAAGITSARRATADYEVLCSQVADIGEADLCMVGQRDSDRALDGACEFSASATSVLP